MELRKPVVGIGACLVGQKVRYNGEAKRKSQHIEAIRDHAHLRMFCPEMAVGMGVPREPVRLVGALGNERLTDSASHTTDYTLPMQAYAAEVMAGNLDMAGYILVKGSPSCGFSRVKRYAENGNVILNDAVGLFAAELEKLDPLLPLEEDGRLNDPCLRENFVSRVFAYHDWKQFCDKPLSHHGLTEFWSRYKYLLMSRHIESYKTIGRLLSDARAAPLAKTAERFITLLMQGLKHVATRKLHTNVLHHIQGYLKPNLESDEKQEMDALIAQYKCGHIPLVVPITLLKHHFKRHSYSYIDNQAYMQPYPEQLSLRNLI
ncbi:MAG: hypothetical protein ACI9JM_002349 [Halioglobus sp.]|jgi:uncharacterized protein YbgA (DUF1722 family)/uncharacterized protein YbbK (DUF523 family)